MRDKMLKKISRSEIVEYIYTKVLEKFLSEHVICSNTFVFDKIIHTKQYEVFIAR